MDEVASIDDACSGFLQALVTALYQSLIDAQGDGPKTAAAEGRFKAGLALVRTTRQRATMLLA